MNRVSVGLDIGGTKTLGVVLTPEGTVAQEFRMPTRHGTTGVVETAAHVVAHLLANLDGATLDQPVGVGVPGLVDVASGTVRHAVNLGLGEDPVPLATMLSLAIGRPVVIDNDVNAAALGAAHGLRGDDAGTVPDLGYLSLGTGLAAGLVLDGRVHRGGRGAAGEIGHIPVDPAGPVCRCGQRGCLETFASGAALARAWPSDPDVPAAVALFRAAAAGDVQALAVRHSFATAVAAAVRVLTLTVDVDLVVLGGGISQLGDDLVAVVTQALCRQAESSPLLASLRVHERLAVTPAHLPVPAMGAALLAQEMPAARPSGRR